MMLRFRRTRVRLLSPQLWKTRLVFWAGAVLVGLAAVLFAVASAYANDGFRGLAERWPLLPLILSPLVLVLAAWLTQRFFPGAQGSGIPQAIAALERRDRRSRAALLSLRLAVGKILLTVLGLFGGASIGREGPTVHVGASIMYSLGRRARFPLHFLDRGLILAGSAAGIAAAFNTPLAGIVFAIEEMSRSFEERTSGTMLTAVVFAGVTAVAIQGNYHYFGSNTAELAVGSGWLAVLVCGLGGGLIGGLFSSALIHGTRRIAPWQHRRPLLVAGACGLALALIGLASGGSSYGTGYAEASQLVTGSGELDGGFPLFKLAATVVSYLSGIPGGIFAPTLATGAGFGASLAPMFDNVPGTALVILAMAGYFAGVVQTPITALVIVTEMTANQSMLLPIMATSFLAYAVSRTVCPQPIYRALATAFLAAAQDENDPPRDDDPDAPTSQHAFPRAGLPLPSTSDSSGGSGQT